MATRSDTIPLDSTFSLDNIIDLTTATSPPVTAHRLAELVQVLTGCSAERAELALRDPMPTGPATNADALTTTAKALVQLRSRQPA